MTKKRDREESQSKEYGSSQIDTQSQGKVLPKNL